MPVSVGRKLFARGQWPAADVARRLEVPDDAIKGKKAAAAATGIGGHDALETATWM